MSFKRLQRVMVSACLAGFLLSWAQPVQTAELPPAKKAEHSDPFESEEEARELTAPKSETKTESLKTQSFGPSGSLRGLPAPVLPSRPVGPANKSQDLMDWKKDWVFSDPESLLGNPQKQETFGIGPEKKKEEENLSPMERYYLKSITPAAAPTKTERDNSSDDSARDELLPQGLRMTEAFLEEVVTEQERQSSLGGARFESENFLGGGNGSMILGPELTPAQKFRQEAFRQLMQESFVMPGTTPGINPGPAQPAADQRLEFKAQTDLGLSGVLRAPETQLGVVPPMPSLTEVNTRALTPQTPMLQSPAMQQNPLLFKQQGAVKSGPPPRPTFQAPRRPF